MNSTFLKNLRERLEEANRQNTGHNFQLLFNPSNSNEAYIVDLSYRASCNVINAFTINRLVANIPCWFLETYYVDNVAADEYSTVPGYYFAISFYL